MGLVQYDSSDEDEEIQTLDGAQHLKPSVEKYSLATERLPDSAHAQEPDPSRHPPDATQPPPPTASIAGLEPGPVLGPAFGPSLPPPQSQSQPLGPSLPEPDVEEVDLSFLDSQHPSAQPQQQSQPGNPSSSDPPRSPYTATRTLLRDLTLPAVPNMDIPPSPPGTPPPGHDALTAKFDNFLRLKRARGVHFNERLAASTGMRNPSLTDKLLGFVGVDTTFSSRGGGERRGDGDGDGDGYGDSGGDYADRAEPKANNDDDDDDDDTQRSQANGGSIKGMSQGKDKDSGKGRVVGTEQYATALSLDVWDPGCFPAWAYRGALRKAQEQWAKERERKKGEPVEFVTAAAVAPAAAGAVPAFASTSASAPGSRSGTPTVGGGGKRKGRFDT